VSIICVLVQCCHSWETWVLVGGFDRGNVSLPFILNTFHPGACYHRICTCAKPSTRSQSCVTVERNYHWHLSRDFPHFSDGRRSTQGYWKRPPPLRPRNLARSEFAQEAGLEASFWISEARFGVQNALPAHEEALHPKASFQAAS
jgi:hypothetical protein